MSQDSVFETALSLPLSERAELAVRLQQSLNRPDEGFDFTNIRDKVEAITQEMFPGKCEFTHEFDPEYPDDRYVVVNVEAHGAPKVLVDLNCQWHERIRQSFPKITRELRLLIMPV